MSKFRQNRIRENCYDKQAAEWFSKLMREGNHRLIGALRAPSKNRTVDYKVKAGFYVQRLHSRFNIGTFLIIKMCGKWRVYGVNENYQIWRQIGTYATLADARSDLEEPDDIPFELVDRT